MRKYLFHIILGSLLIINLSSCKTVAPKRDYQALAQSAMKLGIDINYDDNPKLYISAAQWMGTPHRLGGNSKKGIDCSGLTSQLYKSVYNKTLPRSSVDQKKACQNIPKRSLKEGDLVFFSTDKSKKKVSHVGIYLKDGKFIHTSTSSGVRIDKLDDSYYIANWISGGRPN